MKVARLFFIILSVFVLFTACFNEKESPFYNSTWIMDNYDQNNQKYYHQLLLTEDHRAEIKTSYYDSTNIIIWKGTYKINSKKITFNFTECSRYEDGKKTGDYKSGPFIKYYTGEFLYSVAKISERKRMSARNNIKQKVYREIEEENTL